MGGCGWARARACVRASVRVCVDLSTAAARVTRGWERAVGVDFEQGEQLLELFHVKGQVPVGGGNMCVRVCVCSCGPRMGFCDTTCARLTHTRARARARAHTHTRTYLVKLSKDTPLTASSKAAATSAPSLKALATFLPRDSIIPPLPLPLPLPLLLLPSAASRVPCELELEPELELELDRAGSFPSSRLRLFESEWEWACCMLATASGVTRPSTARAASASCGCRSNPTLQYPQVCDSSPFSVNRMLPLYPRLACRCVRV